MSHCCNTQTKNTPTRKRLDPFLLGILIVTLVILGIVVYAGKKIGAASSISTSDQIKIAVNEKTYDWGTISYDGGIVSKSFTINNPGKETLKLYDIKTSCMCTTAQLKTANTTSEKFEMHEKSNSVFEILPGETAELIVEFDPTYHGPSGIGSISRTVTMNTNSKILSQIEFHLTANVIKQ